MERGNSMMRRRDLGVMALGAAFATPAWAQTFPARPVRIVVPFPPGGSTDITARVLGARLSELWGVPVVVENRAGGDGVIGAEAVARSTPDGHTLLLAATSFAISAAMRRRLPYDALRDFAPVTMIGTISNVLIVHPSLPANTVAEFIALARAQPGKLNFASAGASTGQRFAFELLKQRLGVDVVHVPYRGGAPAAQAIVAGEVQSMIINGLEATPLIQGNRVRALAVTTAQRIPAFPDVPTLAETVLPGLDVSVWQSVLAMAGTPPAVIAKLNADIRRVVAEPAITRRLQDLGLTVTTGTPEQLGGFLAEEIATWTRVARDAGIQED
jgi:tripartite-type tricarboxylate transporter receptor subunit TctC